MLEEKEPETNEAVVETVVENSAAVEVAETVAAPVVMEAKAASYGAPVQTEQQEEEEEELELVIDDAPAVGAAHDDYNWGMDKRGRNPYTDAERKAMFNDYDQTLSQVAENEIVKGKVSAISGGDVVLDVNFKSDGLIALSEFRQEGDLKPGDMVEVYVETQEDKNGQLVLSRHKARILRAWESIVDSFKNGTVIRGIVRSKTKGGLIVECNGLETFLPGSQIDIKPIVDYDQYVGKTMEFKVVKINEQIKNAVVSHKALIESDLAEQRETILGGLEKGQVLEGVVKNITDFGAFLDLGGVDGLLYITDISWGRINHPTEVLTNGQKIHVVVLDFDENKKRISLGLKQLTPHPWDVLAQEVGENATIKGKVVNIEDYGAFIEIRPGVEGLIHISEVSWGNQMINAKDYFKIGAEIEAKVVHLDRHDRKMSLSIKQLSEDPWRNIEDTYPLGSRHTATVKNLTQYGVFVELGAGIGGMVHISDLSWTKRYGHPSEFTKPGQPLEVIVLDVDRDSRKLSLGHKQIEDDPWNAFENIFPIGSYHEGTVLRRDDRGAIISLPHGLEAFAPAKHIRKENNQMVDQGETLTFKVIEFNRDDKRILVSHTRYLDDIRRDAEATMRRVANKEDEELQTAIRTTQEKVERSTLGDLSALSQLRKQFSASAAPEAPKKAEKAKAEAAEKPAEEPVAEPAVEAAVEPTAEVASEEKTEE